MMKRPSWKTRVQQMVSGKELRAAYMSYPLWQFSLSYEFLRAGAQAELQSLVGFFNARQGSFDSFLYSDPNDSSVSGQGFGTGDGATASFQLVRNLGAFIEPVMNLSSAPSIYVDGVLKAATTDYSIGSTGLVAFTTAPANGAVLTWTGAFYFRVRFLQDMAEFENFMHQLWTLKRLEFIGAVGNKV